MEIRIRGRTVDGVGKQYVIERKRWWWRFWIAVGWFPTLEEARETLPNFSPYVTKCTEL